MRHAVRRVNPGVLRNQLVRRECGAAAGLQKQRARFVELPSVCQEAARLIYVPGVAQAPVPVREQAFEQQGVGHVPGIDKCIVHEPRTLGRRCNRAHVSSAYLQAAASATATARRTGSAVRMARSFRGKRADIVPANQPRNWALSIARPCW